MTAQTHKQFCIWTAYFGVIYMYVHNLNEVNYYLMLYIMLKVAKDGALFPDVDHNWRNVKEKTAVNWIINKLIHITGGKHRSWQTHSWDICLISWVGLMVISNKLFSLKVITNVDFVVLNMIIISFYTGWVSHLISDMLTSAGVRLFCWNKKKIKFVPKKMRLVGVIMSAIVFACIGGISYKLGYIAIGVILMFIGVFMLIAGIRLGNITFNTGKEWEMFVYSMSRKINLVMGIFTLLFPLLYKGGYIGKIIKLLG